MLSEWQRACEKIYRHASVVFSCSNFGNGVTYIMSDSRCNEHITSRGCVERPVRIPAALKGARLAGAETGRNIEFLLSVGDGYMTQAEMKVIGMAHCSSYLKRMRKKCLAIEPGVTGAALTENSDFEGGEDTSTLLPLFLVVDTCSKANSFPSCIYRRFSRIVHCCSRWGRCRRQGSRYDCRGAVC
jgi:hypothetical protein